MDLTPMHKRVIALDVHQARITACAVVEHDDGRVEVTKREFGAFKRDRRALAQWSLEIGPEVVVMESTGVYWKSPYAALEARKNPQRQRLGAPAVVRVRAGSGSNEMCLEGQI